MAYPSLTAFYGSVLALIYVALAFWVMAGRVSDDALFGDADGKLSRRIRGHGNFAEYVPLALILIGLVEASAGSSVLVRTLLVILIVARLLHPVGLFAPKNSPQQFACRGGGIIATLGVILVAAVDLLMK